MHTHTLIGCVHAFSHAAHVNWVTARSISVAEEKREPSDGDSFLSIPFCHAPATQLVSALIFARASSTYLCHQPRFARHSIHGNRRLMLSPLSSLSSPFPTLSFSWSRSLRLSSFPVNVLPSGNVPPINECPPLIRDIVISFPLELLMHFLFRETARDKLPAYRFQNTASYSMKEQNEQRMTDIEDIDSPGMGIRVRTTAPVCYGRNMTFPRPTSSYAHRHELPAIVTEGESCRLLAEVRDDDTCSY